MIDMDELREAMERTVWAMAWADFMDHVPREPSGIDAAVEAADVGEFAPEMREQLQMYFEFFGSPPSMAQKDVMEIAPTEIPEGAEEWVRLFLEEIEERNPDFAELAETAVVGSDADARTLGFYLVCEAVGSGLDWEDDDRVPHKIKLPYRESPRAWLTGEGDWEVDA